MKAKPHHGAIRERERRAFVPADFPYCTRQYLSAKTGISIRTLMRAETKGVTLFGITLPKKLPRETQHLYDWDEADKFIAAVRIFHAHHIGPTKEVAGIFKVEVRSIFRAIESGMFKGVPFPKPVLHNNANWWRRDAIKNCFLDVQNISGDARH